MGSAIIPLVVNLFIEECKCKAINTVPNPSRFWIRCVDENSQQFLQHINSINPHIQFTTENPKDNVFISFIATLVSPGPNYTLITSLYKKHTHTDQYLHLDSHHILSAKYSVFNTLIHRARVVCTNQQLHKEEEDHIRKALPRGNHPTWALNRLQTNINHRLSANQAQNHLRKHQTNNNKNNHNIYIVVSYTKGLGESVKNVCESRSTSSF